MHLPKSRNKRKPNQLPTPAIHMAFSAIGTLWMIDIFEPLSEDAKQALETAVYERIEQFDRTYSRFRKDSLITKMSKKAGTYTLPADGQQLFDLYQKLYKISHGKITPLVGNLLSDAGYDANYSLKPKKLRSVPTWDDVLTYDFPKLTVNQPTILDVGAAGKGYLVDIVGDLLRRRGVRHFCINASGDMLAKGVGVPLPIGLENPDDTTEIIGVAALTDGSICGSAGNRRAWDEFHHIMDPDAQRSPHHLKAVWVKADSAVLADALTTCLFFVSPDVLQKHFDFEYALLGAENDLQHSAHFPAQFFTATKGEA